MVSFIPHKRRKECSVVKGINFHLQNVCFERMGQPRPLFLYFCSFQTQILQKKTVGFSGIRTRIVGVEYEHADHLTTTTAHLQNVCRGVCVSVWRWKWNNFWSAAWNKLKFSGLAQQKRVSVPAPSALHQVPVLEKAHFRGPKLVCEFWCYGNMTYHFSYKNALLLNFYCFHGAPK